jgi:hypothetical protein
MNSRALGWSWHVLVRHLPSRRLRRFWLRRMLGEFGPDAFVALDVTLMKPANVKLGARVVVNAHCILDGRDGELRIGDDTDIGTHTHIWTLEHDPNDPAHGTLGAARHHRGPRLDRLAGDDPAQGSRSAGAPWSRRAPSSRRTCPPWRSWAECRPGSSVSGRTR